MKRNAHLLPSGSPPRTPINTPIRGLRPDGCAAATAGHAAAPPRTLRNSRRLMPAPTSRRILSAQADLLVEGCNQADPAVTVPILIRLDAGGLGDNEVVGHLRLDPRREVVGRHDQRRDAGLGQFVF